MKGKTMQKDKRKVANPDAKKSKSDYQSGKKDAVKPIGGDKKK